MSEFYGTGIKLKLDEGTRAILLSIFFNEVTIHTLPHLKCIRLVSRRSSHLPFKMHQVVFRAFKFPLY